MGFWLRICDELAVKLLVKAAISRRLKLEDPGSLTGLLAGDFSPPRMDLSITPVMTWLLPAE